MKYNSFSVVSQYSKICDNNVLNLTANLILIIQLWKKIDTLNWIKYIYIFILRIETRYYNLTENDVSKEVIT